MKKVIAIVFSTLVFLSSPMALANNNGGKAFGNLGSGIQCTLKTGVVEQMPAELCRLNGGNQ